MFDEASDPLIKRLGEYKKGYTNFAEEDILFAKITPCLESAKYLLLESWKMELDMDLQSYVVRCNKNTYNRFIYHLL